MDAKVWDYTARCLAHYTKGRYLCRDAVLRGLCDMALPPANLDLD